MQIIMLQRPTSVGEQHFDQYVSVCAPGEPQIRVSRLNKKDYR